MTPEFPQPFAQNFDWLLKRLKLHGMQPKTFELYSYGVRRAGEYFEFQIDALTRDQLTDYFAHVVEQWSWSTLKPRFSISPLLRLFNRLNLREKLKNCLST